VKGISFRKNGSSVLTGPRERILDLDSLPDALRFPIILNQVYKAISLPPMSASPHYAIMEYSRCCYNACKFCDNVGFWGNKVTYRSPERVVEELAELKERGVDIFYFMDLNFTADPEKAIQLCDSIRDSGLDVFWYCMSNTATVDSRDDVLHAMKEAGCYKVAWGVESTRNESLQLMNKRVGDTLTTNDQTSRVLQHSLDAGLLNQGYYIIGFPWEDEESILADSEGLKYLPLHQLNVGIFTPIPLSRFYSDMVVQGYVFDPDLEKHDRNTLIYNHPSLTNETIKAIQEKMHADFYESPEYIARVKESCRIDPRFRQAFNDYFDFLGNGVRI